MPVRESAIMHVIRLTFYKDGMRHHSTNLKFDDFREAYNYYLNIREALKELRDAWG